MTTERLNNDELANKLLGGLFRELGDLRKIQPLAVHLCLASEDLDTLLAYYRKQEGEAVADFILGMSGSGEFPISPRLIEELRGLEKETLLVDLMVIMDRDSVFHFREDSFPGKGIHLRDSTGRFLRGRV